MSEKRDATLAKIEVNERGDAFVYLCWALKPGEPQIIAVCTSPEVAERYKAVVATSHPGAVPHVEKILLDHLFGDRDIQSFVYRRAAARRRSGD